MMPHLPTLSENYARNPGAEQAPFAYPDWDRYGTGSVYPVVDVVNPHGGTKCVKVTTTNNVNLQGVLTNQYRIIGRGTYRVGAWLKGPVGVVLRVGIRAIRGNGALMYEHYRVDYTMTGSWMLCNSSPWNIAANLNLWPLCVNFQVHTNTPLPATGTVFYVDDVRVEQVS